MNIQELQELCEREESLIPQLQPYVFPSAMGEGEMIHHPLIIELFYDPKHCGRINFQYRHKVDAIAQALKDEDFESYIWLHERPYRLDAFHRIRRQMTDAQYWHRVASVWIDSENIWQNMKTWKSLWGSLRPGRAGCMDVEEQAVLTGLPDVLTVWRGVKRKSAVKGLSWSLDKDKALWFANRLKRKSERPMLVQGEVTKGSVLAYFDGRNEQEIVSLNVQMVAVSSL